MNSYITWPYQIADHNCRITLVYNKNAYCFCSIRFNWLHYSLTTQCYQNKKINTSTELLRPHI